MSENEKEINLEEAFSLASANAENGPTHKIELLEMNKNKSEPSRDKLL